MRTWAAVCLFENKGYARLDAGFSYRVYHGLELYGWIYSTSGKCSDIPPCP
jgi:hypothetical protein